ncbi:hypothetical protein HD554DRAFT_2011649 [Boletus coccyginus]|nr:hypothetical protein HD554DRAFT_2011649 [Boletus coccyginus]
MSSSEPSSSPAPTRKKRPAEVESSESSDDHDTSDTSSADEDSEDSDALQPLPSTEQPTVLSHAKRRRQKKKQKQNQLAATSSESSPRKRRKLDDAKAPVADDPRRQKRQHSVWVGNLSFRTTQDALRGFFDGVGTITRVHMPLRRGKETQGENMGFAYIDFETPDAKVIAITLSEGELDGRNLLIKDGDDFTGRPARANADLGGEGEGEKPVKNSTSGGGKGLSKTAQEILRAQKQPPAPTLFLGNLGFETTEGSIRELFEAHRHRGHKDKGQGGDAAKSKDVWIRKIRMGTFEDSGACKGFAFVDFTSVEYATEALVDPRNHRLNGRHLVVEYASLDAVRRGGGGGGPRNSREDRDQKRRSGTGKTPQRGSANVPYSKQCPPRHIEQRDAEDAEMPAEETTPRSRRPDRAGHDRAHTRRAKPGAALAHAQRQSAAILPSQGQKTVF